MRAAVALGLLVLAAAPLAAQDPIDRGVRVGITYTAGTRPRLVILPGAGLDSVRAILQRDLDYSDRFEVLPLESGGGAGSTVNYQLYRTLGAEYGVEVRTDAAGVVVRLHDIGTGTVRQQQPFPLPAQTAPGFRMAVHRVSDEVGHCRQHGENRLRRTEPRKARRREISVRQHFRRQRQSEIR